MVVQPGDQLKIPASTWNGIIEASSHYHRTGRLGYGGAPLAPQRNSNVVKVKNSSGADRRQGEILELTDFLLTEVRSDQLWFDGDTPSGSTVKFGVLLQALPSGSIGDAQVSGACMALVDINDTSDTHATPTNADEVLQSGTSGTVEILYAPASTGEQECPVLLANEASSSQLGFFFCWDNTGQTMGSSETNVNFARAVQYDTGGIFHRTSNTNIICDKDGTYLIIATFVLEFTTSSSFSCRWSATGRDPPNVIASLWQKITGSASSGQQTACAMEVVYQENNDQIELLASRVTADVDIISTRVAIREL